MWTLVADDTNEVRITADRSREDSTTRQHALHWGSLAVFGMLVECVEALARALGYGETRPSYQSIQPPHERDKGTVFSGSVDVAASSPR